MVTQQPNEAPKIPKKLWSVNNYLPKYFNSYVYVGDVSETLKLPSRLSVDRIPVRTPQGKKSSTSRNNPKFFRGGTQRMSYTRIAPSNALFRRVVSVTLALIVISTAALPFKATTDDVSTQLVQSIDLSAASADIQLLGAGDADHLSGNGSANSFATFPRSHALAA